MKNRVTAPYILILVSFAWLSGCGNSGSKLKANRTSAIPQSSAFNYYPPAVSNDPATDGDSDSDDDEFDGDNQDPETPYYISSGSSQLTQTQDMGTNLTLYVQFNGYPVPTYQWYRNGTAISGATSATLDLIGIKKTDYGSYTVKATNAYGTGQSPAMIINPRVMVGQVGSRECNGAQCFFDKLTAEQVCKQKFGSASVLYDDYSYMSAYYKYHNAFCGWTGTGWLCNDNCKGGCTGYNVLGYVQCLQ